MKTSTILAIGVSLLTLVITSQAFAWGPKGHRIIAAIAQQHLSASTQAAIQEILHDNDLPTASTWADEMRSSKGNVEFWTRYSAPWHYADVPAGKDYASATKNPLGDALMAIDTFSAILRNEPVPQGPVRTGLEFYFGKLETKQPEVKAFALRFLIHILGDLQQPLHMGYEVDRGGNDVKVLWFGKASNLHTLWDSLLVDQADLSYSEYAARLNSRISRTPAADIRTLEQIDAKQWLFESQALLERIYAKHSGSNDFSYDYAAEFAPSLETQLVKGGLRTANFLNSLFGG